MDINDIWKLLRDIDRDAHEQRKEIIRLLWLILNALGSIGVILLLTFLWK